MKRLNGHKSSFMDIWGRGMVNGVVTMVKGSISKKVFPSLVGLAPFKTDNLTIVISNRMRGPSVNGE